MYNLILVALYLLLFIGTKHPPLGRIFALHYILFRHEIRR